MYLLPCRNLFGRIDPWSVPQVQAAVARGDEDRLRYEQGSGYYRTKPVMFDMGVRDDMATSCAVARQRGQDDTVLEVHVSNANGLKELFDHVAKRSTKTDVIGWDGHNVSATCILMYRCRRLRCCCSLLTESGPLLGETDHRRPRCKSTLKRVNMPRYRWAAEGIYPRRVWAT